MSDEELFDREYETQTDTLRALEQRLLQLR